MSKLPVETTTTTLRASILDTTTTLEQSARVNMDRGQREMASQSENLYDMVETINQKNQIVEKRIVDLNHSGTRNWFTKHLIYARALSYVVEIRSCTDVEVADYVKSRSTDLQKRYAN